MKKLFSAMAVLVLMAMAVFGPAKTAHADEVKFIGVISKIDIAGKDATTSTATVKDNSTGDLIVLTVNDDLTLDKFKDHRIVEGDEIRCKYEIVDGKKISKLFRKTAGC